MLYIKMPIKSLKTLKGLRHTRRPSEINPKHHILKIYQTHDQRIINIFPQHITSMSNTRVKHRQHMIKTCAVLVDGMAQHLGSFF